MLHALEDQALEPCERSRTALNCLANSAEGSPAQWIYMKLEKVTGHGGSCFHRFLIALVPATFHSDPFRPFCSTIYNLMPPLISFKCQGQVMERLEISWCFLDCDLGLPHLRWAVQTHRQAVSSGHFREEIVMASGGEPCQSLKQEVMQRMRYSDWDWESETCFGRIWCLYQSYGGNSTTKSISFWILRCPSAQVKAFQNSSLDRGSHVYARDLSSVAGLSM